MIFFTSRKHRFLGAHLLSYKISQMLYFFGQFYLNNLAESKIAVVYLKMLDDYAKSLNYQS